MQASRTSPFDLIVFDFKGTLQVKQKKIKADKQSKKLIKLRKRAENFYEAISKAEIDSLPSFDDFFACFLKTKEKLDKEKPDCYSWSEALDMIVTELQLPDISKYYNQFQDSIPAPLYPGTKELLQKIQDNKIPLVMLRNSNLSRVSMEKTLQKLGIEKYFKYIVTSGEVGLRKPDKRIFEFCVTKGLPDQKVDPQRILMIGNETEADISGAKSLGWKTVLLCNTERSSNGLADYDLPSLVELHDVIFPPQL